MSPAQYRILTFDGGGVRGLLSALLLQEMMKQQPAQFANIDLIAGTSTGGLIALGLAGGLTSDQLVSIYQSQCNSIFTPLTSADIANIDSGKFVLNITQEIAAKFKLTTTEEFLLGGGLSVFYGVVQTNAPSAIPGSIVPEYKTDGFQALLQSYFSPQTRLSQLAQAVLVTTLQLSVTTSQPPITQWQPLLLHNLPNLPSGDSTIIDAALSTAAAPTYFPPHNHPQYQFCVDGGMFANNPSAVALAAFCRAKQIDASQVTILSVGTGLNPSSIPPTNDICNGLAGTLQWIDPFASYAPNGAASATPLLDAVMANTSAVNDMIAGALLGTTRYRRINPVLSQLVNLDDCASAQILVDAANTYMKSSEWTDDLNWIQSNF